ncbi:MAG TPA: alkaline phosphatase family protein, partial [Candidatus Paceibacterota bacterium]|nr:alkaline phosphatase family protein [Candidatus Paceibacterota bacterium]
MRNFIKLLFLLLFCPSVLSAAGNAEHVVVIVWDGMRPDFITQELTPTLYQLAQSGVNFENHHSAYLTATEVNGTAIATGQNPARSGILANRMYFPKIKALEPVDTQDPKTILAGDDLSHGHYLMSPTVAEILQSTGRKTRIAGSKAVALLHDRRQRPDDYELGVNLFEGKALPPSALTPVTNLLGKFPGTQTNSALPNEPRDEWTTSALLGPLWTNDVPAFSLLWLSEPDFSQHAKGPGSPKALAALANCDRKLAAVLRELERRGIRDKTDVFVVSDHGFSTIQSTVDVAKKLNAAGFKASRRFQSTPDRGDILIVSQSGSVFFYVTDHDSKVIKKLVQFLQKQEFSGAIFTRKGMKGTFALSEAGIDAKEAPDVVLSMRWSDVRSKTGAPGCFVSDGGVPGSGAHASLCRSDLHNICIAAGPDLKKGFKNTMPTGNVDLAP